MTIRPQFRLRSLLIMTAVLAAVCWVVSPNAADERFKFVVLFMGVPVVYGSLLWFVFIREWLSSESWRTPQASLSDKPVPSTEAGELTD